MSPRWRIRAVPPLEDPPPSGDVLATFGLTTGTAVFGLALPQGVATNGVKVGALDTQTDVFLTWDDGSIRHCMVSCVVPSSGDYEITEGLATSGSFTPTWPSASAAFVIGGATYTATLPSLTTTDPWLVGPVVKEYRVVVTPMNGATPHPVLRAFFDVRSYASGGHRVDVHVRNVLDSVDTNAFTYNLTVTVGGSSVLTKSNALHKTCTLWRRAFATGSPALSTITYDLEPYHLSYAIPRYDAATVGNSTWPDSGALSDSRFDILGFGDMAEGMGSPGGRAELGYYPSWCAQWVVHQEADAYAYMIRAAEQSGSWSGHITASDGSSITLEDSPNYWLDGQDRAGTMNIPNDPLNFEFLVGWGEALEINHLPQLTHIPYIVTGDRFFIDQGRLWAHAALLMSYPGDGWRNYEPSSGVGGMNLYPHQVRGNAWGGRSAAEAAIYLPDADVDKAYLVGAMTRNLKFWDWVATILDPGGPNGLPFVSATTGSSTTLGVVPWQHDYVGYAINRCHALGFTDGQDMALQLATWRVRLLTPASGWDPANGCPYFVPYPPEEPGVGTQSGAGNNPQEGSGTPTIPAGIGRTWKTMAEIQTDNFTGDPPTIPGPYTGEALVALRIAIQMGLTGAQAAYDYLEPDASPVHDGWKLLGVEGSEG